VTSALKKISKYFVDREMSRTIMNKKRQAMEIYQQQLEMKSVIRIQAICRGYLIRCDTLKLFNRLVEAKLKVLGPKIKARNLLRKAIANRRAVLAGAIAATDNGLTKQRSISPILGPPISIKSPTSSASSKKSLVSKSFDSGEVNHSSYNTLDKSTSRTNSQLNIHKDKSKTLHLGERATGALAKFFRRVFPDANTSKSAGNPQISNNNNVTKPKSAQTDFGSTGNTTKKMTVSEPVKKSSDVMSRQSSQVSSIDSKGEVSPGNDDGQKMWKELNAVKLTSLDKAMVEEDAKSDVSTVINAPMNIREIIQISSNNNNNNNTDDLPVRKTSKDEQEMLASLSAPKGKALQLQLELDTEEDIDIGNDDIYSSPPIVNLGAPARITLTLQQHLIVIEMWTLLRKGVTIFKHGLTGKPRVRYLYCDSPMKTLYWREHSMGPNPETPNWSKNRRSSFLKEDNDRRLLFSEILEVRADYSTEVMNRSQNKNYVYNNSDTAFISIILSERTLDIEVQVDQWDSLFHAFQILTNYYRVLLPNFSMKNITSV